MGPAENLGRRTRHRRPRVRPAAEIATRELNAGFLTVMLEGSTPTRISRAGGDAPRFTDEELRTIASPVDFVGINVYTPGYTSRLRRAAGYRVVPVNASHPKMQSSWHVVRARGHVLGAASGAFDLGREVDLHHRERLRGFGRRLRRWASLRLGSRDVPARFPGQLQRATSEGVPVTATSSGAPRTTRVDDGFGTRFGMVYVDFETTSEPRSSAPNGSARPHDGTRSSDVLPKLVGMEAR